MDASVHKNLIILGKQRVEFAVISIMIGTTLKQLYGVSCEEYRYSATAVRACPGATIFVAPRNIGVVYAKKNEKVMQMMHFDAWLQANLQKELDFEGRAGRRMHHRRIKNGGLMH